jgi:hypothetical protein
VHYYEFEFSKFLRYIDRKVKKRSYTVLFFSRRLQQKSLSATKKKQTFIRPGDDFEYPVFKPWFEIAKFQTTLLGLSSSLLHGNVSHQ